MNVTDKFVAPRWFLVVSPMILISIGCYQPYMNSPYGAPPAAPYGAPQQQFQAPGGGQVPQGQMMPPSLSSNPAPQYYQPTPAQPGSAPPFGGTPTRPAKPQGSGNSGETDSGEGSVPRYNDPSSDNSANGSGKNGSPYFENEQGNFRPETYAPQEKKAPQESVAQADFQDEKEGRKSETIDMTSGQKFEPPVISSRSQPEGFPSNATAQAQPLASANGADSGIAAPPVDDPKSSPSGSQGLEGIVRYEENEAQWYLELKGLNGEGGSAAGGRMPLAGTPEVLNGLKSGQRYRLTGFIKTSPAPGEPDRFQVETHESLASEMPRSPFDQDP